MQMLSVLLLLMCTMLVSGESGKSGSDLLGVLNGSKGAEMHASGRSANETGLDENRKRRIREQFQEDQAYRDQLIRDEAIKRERELEQDRERTKQQLEQNGPLVAKTVALPVVPVVQGPPAAQFQQSGTTFNSQGQPMQSNQLVAQPVAQPQQQGFDPVKLINSGYVGELLAPKILGQSEAANTLIPKLITPSLTMGQQQPMIQQNPGGYYGGGQYPDGRQFNFPNQQQPAVPSFGGVPQQFQNQLQIPNQNFGGLPMVNRDLSGYNYNPQMNPGLYANNLYPQGTNMLGK